ncbi:MAG: Na+/H+ antiporter subunit E [Synergistaceae bacterium]|nr:Na+/H+ antiporter subunit E [Synergistaceae bacterium]
MFFVYFSLWLILCGRVTVEAAAIGAAVSLLLGAFTKKFLKLDLPGAAFVKTLRLIPDALVYVAVLLVDTVRASLSVMRTTLAPELDVEPRLVRFKTSLKTQRANTTLANSLALAPGAIAVSLNGNEALVHALDADTAEGLAGTIFERLLAGMERKANA